MPTPSKQNRSPQKGSDVAPSPAEVLTAYLGKSPIVQAVIRDLVNVLQDANLPPEERTWAETALLEALFRHRSAPPGNLGGTGEGKEKRQPSGLRHAHERMETEERAFAVNLARLLQQKQISQAELARRVGVRPSAISMMLARRCRPQRRTVEKIAQALGVKLQELWPG